MPAEDISSETEIDINSNKEFELQRNIVKKNENMTSKSNNRLSESDIDEKRSKSPIQINAEKYIKNAI